MAKDLAKLFDGVEITSQASPEDLQQSPKTQALVSGVRAQIKYSKKSDWIIGMHSNDPRAGYVAHD